MSNSNKAAVSSAAVEPVSSPINYQLIRSKRRSIGLQINATGLIIRAPLRCSERSIASAIAQKTNWINAKLALLRQRQQQIHYPRNQCWLLGQALNLSCSAEQLQLSTNSAPAASLWLKHQIKLPSRLDLPTANQLQPLQQWLIDQAKLVLPQRLAAWGAKMNLSPQKLTIRAAKTRWGSASSQQRISLNWRLIELPPELIDYVIVHELAHLRQLNHSAAFWQIVQQQLPHYQQLRQQLKQYQLTPDWLQRINLQP